MLPLNAIDESVRWSKDRCYHRLNNFDKLRIAFQHAIVRQK